MQDRAKDEVTLDLFDDQMADLRQWLAGRCAVAPRLQREVPQRYAARIPPHNRGWLKATVATTGLNLHCAGHRGVRSGRVDRRRALLLRIGFLPVRPQKIVHQCLEVHIKRFVPHLVQRLPVAVRRRAVRGHAEKLRVGPPPVPGAEAARHVESSSLSVDCRRRELWGRTSYLREAWSQGGTRVP